MIDVDDASTAPSSDSLDPVEDTDPTVEPLLLCNLSDGGFDDRVNDRVNLATGPSDGIGLLGLIMISAGVAAVSVRVTTAVHTVSLRLQWL